MRGLTAIALLLAGCAEPDAPTAHRQAQELIGDRALRSLSQAELAQAERLAAQARALDPELHEASFTLAALYTWRAVRTRTRPRTLPQSSGGTRPDDGRAYAELGLSLAAQGRYSGALRAYQDAVRRGEKSALIYARLGHAYQALGHLQENLHAAQAAYRASLQLASEQAEVSYQLARVEARLGRDAEARTLMEQALDDCVPNDTGIRADLAALYREAGTKGTGPRRTRRGFGQHATGVARKLSCTTNWGGCSGRKEMARGPWRSLNGRGSPTPTYTRFIAISV